MPFLGLHDQLSTRGMVVIDGNKADIEPKKDWKRANKKRARTDWMPRR